MTTLKLHNYLSTERDLKDYLAELNAINVNSELVSYINNIAVTNLDANNILRTQAFDKSSKLPNFTTYLTNGIDMSLLMPDCEASKKTLEAIKFTVEKNTTYKREIISFVSYNTKNKQFELSKAGEALLKSKLVVLDGVNEQLYNKIVDVHKFMLDNDKRNTSFFTLEILRGEELAIEALISKIVI